MLKMSVVALFLMSSLFAAVAVATESSTMVRSFNLEPVSSDCLPPAYNVETFDTDAKAACAMRIIERASELLELAMVCLKGGLPNRTCVFVSERTDIIAPLRDRVFSKLAVQFSDGEQPMTMMETVAKMDRMGNWRNPETEMHLNTLNVPVNKRTN